MGTITAVLTGAGISRGFPAHLPLGDEFHDALLSGCFQAAKSISSGAVGRDGRRAPVIGGRRNILGCIEDCLEAGTVETVLDCMRVRLPSEEHLLCAMLAARGVLQLTVNFDNGIELAYRLLTRQVDLPAGVPTDYREALARWRAAMPPAPALRVVATPGELASRDFRYRPLLVKLRGSVDVGTDGTVVPLRPTMEDLECTLLDDDRRLALHEATTNGRLLITGYSGRDLDVFETLESLLRPGGFDWVTPELDKAIATRLRKVDPGQPRRGTARHALRAELGDLPEWPSSPIIGADFTQRFVTWWQSVPRLAAAEAYARILSEAGHHDQAVVTLRAVVAGTVGWPATARVRLRLGDALARRAGRGDTAEATALYVSVACGRRTPGAARAYAITRWTESRAGTAPSFAMLLTAVLAGTTALLVARADRGRRRVGVRVLIGMGRIALQHVEAQLRRSLSTDGRRTATPVVARAADRILGWAGRRSARAGTATRQSDLDLLRLRAEFVLALLRGTPPAPGSSTRLDATERAYAHRGNRAGVVEAKLTRALFLLASRDAPGFARVVSDVARSDAEKLRPRTASDLARLLGWARSLGIQPASSDPDIVRVTTMDHA